MCAYPADGSSPFVDGVFLPDFGLGTGIAVWAFRACASGHSKCPPVTRGFDHAFGERGAEALADIMQLVRIFGYAGRRHISIAMPGCGRMTSDELSLAAMLAAAQAGEPDERDAHATWLFGCHPEPHVGDVVERIAQVFSEYELPMDRPDISVDVANAPLDRHPPALVALEGGRA
ncbi:MAG: hypothetical protein ACFB0Z_08120 [Candidatus Phaeomarinobacter sp.]